MLLFTVSLNLFIVLVVFALTLWGVYVLLFVGGRQAKKTKRPTPTAYTFFQPTTPGTGGGAFKGTVPLSTVNIDELRFGMTESGMQQPSTTPPLPNPLAASEAVAPSDTIPDDNPDFAVMDDEFAAEEPSLAKPRQVMVVQATPASVNNSTSTHKLNLDQLPLLDEDVLNQVEAIFGNVDQMELLDHYHTETNRLMLLTGEDYYTVFHRLIENETEENRTYLTSMLVPAGTPDYTLSLATVLAMGDEKEVED